MFWGFCPGFWIDPWIYWMGSSGCAPIRGCPFETNLHHLIFYTDVSFCTMKIKGVFWGFFSHLYKYLQSLEFLKTSIFNSRNSWKSKVKNLSGALAFPSLWYASMQRAWLIQTSIHWKLTSHRRALSDWEAAAETTQKRKTHFQKNV